jgi:hypothetical protein
MVQAMHVMISLSRDRQTDLPILRYHYGGDPGL